MRTVSSSSKRVPSKRPVKKPVQTPQKPSENSADGPRGLKAKFKWFSVRLGLDMSFLFLVLVLLIIGILMMFSASYPSGFAYKSDSLYYLKKQLVFAALGIGLMIVLSYFDYHHFHIFAYVVLAFALGCLVWVLFVPTNGVRRWIYIGSLGSFQPSEIAKLAVVLVFADWGSRHTKKMGTFKYGVLIPGCVSVLIIILMLLEPHYSGIAIIIMLTALMMVCNYRNSCGCIDSTCGTYRQAWLFYGTYGRLGNGTQSDRRLILGDLSNEKFHICNRLGRILGTWTWNVKTKISVYPRSAE